MTVWENHTETVFKLTWKCVWKYPHSHHLFNITGAIFRKLPNLDRCLASCWQTPTLLHFSSPPVSIRKVENHLSLSLPPLGISQDSPGIIQSQNGPGCGQQNYSSRLPPAPQHTCFEVKIAKTLMDRICESPITSELEFMLHPKCSSQAEITCILIGAFCSVLFCLGRKRERMAVFKRTVQRKNSDLEGCLIRIEMRVRISGNGCEIIFNYAESQLCHLNTYRWASILAFIERKPLV